MRSPGLESLLSSSAHLWVPPLCRNSTLSHPGLWGNFICRTLAQGLKASIEMHSKQEGGVEGETTGVWVPHSRKTLDLIVKGLTCLMKPCICMCPGLGALTVQLGPGLPLFPSSSSVGPLPPQQQLLLVLLQPGQVCTACAWCPGCPPPRHALTPLPSAHLQVPPDLLARLVPRAFTL